MKTDNLKRLQAIYRQLKALCETPEVPVKQNVKSHLYETVSKLTADKDIVGRMIDETIAAIEDAAQSYCDEQYMGIMNATLRRLKIYVDHDARAESMRRR